MSDFQFHELMRIFGTAFPEVAKWLHSAGAETIAAWKSVLIGLDFEDAKAAVQAILAGDVPFPQPWSSFPSLIRRLATRITGDRAARDRMAAIPQTQRPNSARSAVAMLEDLRGFMKDHSHAEAMAMLANKYPIAEDKQPRFHCLRCRDSGHVRVWAARSIQSVIWDEQPFKSYTAVALCDCDSGRARHTDANGRFHQPAIDTFNGKRHCVVRSGDRAELAEWVEQNDTAGWKQKQMELVG